MENKATTEKKRVAGKGRRGLHIRIFGSTVALPPLLAVPEIVV